MAVKPRRRRDAGDLCQLRVELWAGIRYAAALLENATLGPEVKLRAVSALATASGIYRQLLETSEMADRLAELEAWKEALELSLDPNDNGYRRQ
jgi:hypothetical protein